MPDENIVRVEKDSLALMFDRAENAIKASRVDGSVLFGPLVARACFRSVSNKAYDPVSSLVRGWKVERVELETPLGAGPGFCAVLEDAPGLPARMKWEAALLGGEEAVARITIENRDRRALRVQELYPLAYRGADPGLDMGAGYLAWRFFRTGYQSWTPAGSIGVMDKDYAPRFFLPSRAGTNPRTPHSSRPGEKTSDWMAQVVEPKLGLSALVGFISSADMLSRVELEVKYDRFRRLEAVSDGEGVVLDPGEEISSEWCLLSLSHDPLSQQARYFELWGKVMRARTSLPATGWCSWYFAFTGVSERVVEKNLDSPEKLEGLEVVQIDDGFEPYVGEWTSWNHKFPSPPKGLADRIKGQGKRPGLWLAPFLVSRDSHLFRKHPDWALHTDRGRPLIAFVHPQWKGHIIYALDPTHPGVLDWLKKTINTVVHDYGFTYLKLDFLYAAALAGVRHDLKATGAVALRRGLLAIREAAGDDAYILGCGCPLGPAIGIVDSMRVSQDIDIRWKMPVRDWITGIPAGPGAQNCLKNNMARSLMHGRLWANDPDCAVLRDVYQGLKAHEIQSELTLYYLTGGAVFLSEDLAGLTEERRLWFKRLLPPSGEAAVPLDLFERDFPEIFFLAKDDSALVALFNWPDQERGLCLDTGRLGLIGSWHVFDFWAGNYLGETSGRMELGKVRPHGVKYLRLVRADDRPRLLCTDLHLGMGEVGFEAGEEGQDLKLKINLPGQRSGKVWAVFPGGLAVPRQVEFEDSWEGVIAPE